MYRLMIYVDDISGMGCMDIRIIMSIIIDEICPIEYLLKRYKALLCVAYFTNSLGALFC